MLEQCRRGKHPMESRCWAGISSRKGQPSISPFAEPANVSLDQTTAVEVERAPGRKNQEELR